MVTQTLLLIMVGAAIRSSDVVKAGGKKTLAAMDAPTQAWGAPCKQSSSGLLPTTSSCRAWSLDRGWCSRESVQVPQEFMTQPLLPSHLRSQRTWLPNLQYSLSTGARGKKKNLASASLRNASAVKLGNLMS